MTSEFLKYEEATLTDLAGQLKKFSSDLGTESSTFFQKANKLDEVWSGSGKDAFDIAVRNWNTEFGTEGDTSADTAIGLLHTLSGAVTTALENAKAADRGVQNSFSQYE